MSIDLGLVTLTPQTGHCARAASQALLKELLGKGLARRGRRYGQSWRHSEGRKLSQSEGRKRDVPGFFYLLHRWRLLRKPPQLFRHQHALTACEAQTAIKFAGASLARLDL